MGRDVSFGWVMPELYVSASGRVGGCPASAGPVPHDPAGGRMRKEDRGRSGRLRPVPAPRPAGRPVPGLPGRQLPAACCTPEAKAVSQTGRA
ncbi:hypothetical protein GCM10009564_40700 [Streptomyces thermogriseus]|uniref:Uncharacterized protein n=1 Tax=Streptomyces thermogriseus TaxID=75292 RepID=A0ABN1T3L7_9ACTN